MLFSNEFASSEFFKWVVLPLLICVARTCDVTLATLRNVFIAKGLRNVVPIVAIMEAAIWLLSIRQIMQHLDNPVCYVGFAVGFGLGTYVGMFIDRKLAIGTQVIRIILAEDPNQLLKAFAKANIGVTVLEGEGAKGPVKMIFTIVQRKDVPFVAEIIHAFNPHAFYSVEDVRSSSQGIFRKKRDSRLDQIRSLLTNSD
ncbi:MAG: hypothetical protein RIQ89_11 [Bacteroidota bacterium]|jgi:uncharacterized protein YebE (UPF0316 family)